MGCANLFSENSLMRQRSWDLLSILFLGVWHFLYFLPVTLGRQVFIDGDILYSFLPFHTELARALAEGRLPLWTPGIQAGFPLFAEGEVGALYPPNWVFHLLLPTPTALSYIILFHWSWAAIGMYLLCRSLSQRVASGALAAIVFGASGFMLARVPHVPLFVVASWLPWLLLLQIRYRRAALEGKRTNGWFLLMVLAIGLQFLGGSPQLAFLNIGTFVIVGITDPFLRNYRNMPLKTWFARSVRQTPKTVLVTILSVGLGVGLAAIQLLPTAELVALSTRGQDLGEAFFSSFSLNPAYLTQFVFPFQVLGQPTFYNTEYWGYLGMLPLLLALAAPFLRRDPWTWFFFLFALVALALSLGTYQPFYEWLYNVPVFNRFRVPARFLFLFTFAGAYLAGIGLEELSNRLRSSAKTEWKSFVLGMLFAVMIALVIYQAYIQPATVWLELWTRLPLLLLCMSLGIIIVAARRLTTQATFATVAVGLTMLDLAAFAAPFLSGQAQSVSPTEIVGIPRTVSVMNKTPTVSRFLSDKWPSTTRASIRAALLTNLSLQYGKQSATAYLPSLALQRNVEYSQNMSAALRNLLNIRYYLLPLQPLPWDDPPFGDADPEIGLPLDLLRQSPGIPPTRAVQVQVVSYTDQSSELSNGFLVGELVLTLEGGKQIILPLRLGYETADWAFEGIAKIGKVNHAKPGATTSFLAYLSSVGSEFQGLKSIGQFQVAENESPVTVTQIGVRSFLPDGGLAIESVSLSDEQGHSVSLAALLQRNNLTLVFRSHTAAMWENLDAMPRAFIVHQAEIVKDYQSLARLREPGFRPDQMVLLSDGRPLESSEATDQAQTSDQVIITDYKPEQVTISVRADRAGYLVLTDSWYPGWVVRVDGKNNPIYRADYMFRAVFFEPGQHHVAFEYHPASLVWGMWISGLSATVLILLTLWGFRLERGDNKTGY